MSLADTIQKRIEAGREDDFVTWAGSIEEAETILAALRTERKEPTESELVEAIALLEAGLLHTPTMFYTRPHSFGVALRLALDALASQAATIAALERKMAEAVEILRQAMNALGTVDQNDPLEPIADNGMTVWDGMRNESARLWPHYRTFITSHERSAEEQQQ